MVAIAPLVVQPGGAVPERLSLGVIGTVVALKVLDTCKKLHRGVLGQIVGEALPVQPQAKAIFPNQRPVAVDSFQMTPEMQGTHLKTTFCFPV